MQTIRWVLGHVGCRHAEYRGMAGLCLWSTAGACFLSTQGMDSSDEPLLQFKFRVQFYVETHLLLRYVWPTLHLHDIVQV